MNKHSPRPRASFSNLLALQQRLMKKIVVANLAVHDIDSRQVFSIATQHIGDSAQGTIRANRQSVSE